jgi:hypothetical protein
MRGWRGCSSRQGAEGGRAGVVACAWAAATATARLAVLAAGLGGLTAAPVAAQPALRADAAQRIWVEVSGYYPSMRSRARADLPGIGVGTDIDFERDLGLADAKTLPAVQAGVRLGGGWWLEAEYMNLRRSASRRLDRDIVWEDTRYPASVTLSSRFDSDVVRLSVGRSWLASPGLELAAVFGVHATRFEVRLAGELTLGGASAGRRVVEREQLWVPLPTIGLGARLALAPAVDLRARVDWFSLSTGDVSGRLLAASTGLQWSVSPSFGVHAGWRFVDYEVSMARSRWTGAVDYRFSGPHAGLVLRF